MHPNLPTWIIAGLALVVSALSLWVSLQTSSHSRRARNVDLKAELIRRMNSLQESAERVYAKMENLKQSARDAGDFDAYDRITVHLKRDVLQTIRTIHAQVVAVPNGKALEALERFGDELDAQRRLIAEADADVDAIVAAYALVAAAKVGGQIPTPPGSPASPGTAAG